MKTFFPKTFAELGLFRWMAIWWVGIPILITVLCLLSGCAHYNDGWRSGAPMDSPKHVDDYQ